MQDVDICIAGAGIIGLSLALELERRGARVTVLEQGLPLTEASTAAAGMLAASDSENPPQLRPLADLSLRLYPEFLGRLSRLSGTDVPFHTSTALQGLPAHAAGTTGSLTTEELHAVLPELVPGGRRFVRLEEHSLDPRQLAVALLGSVRTAAIDLRTHTRVVFAHSVDGAVEVQTTDSSLRAGQFVDCTGAWAAHSFPLTLDAALGVYPRKGQMVAVALPPELELRMVVRTPEIYVVPRTTGATAGRAVIGATIEDAGFDKTVYPADIARLQGLAVELLPQLAWAQVVESWAGLRPATADGLPLLGSVPGEPNCFLAAGHYRNGILLAPATAWVMAQVLSGESAPVELDVFSPSRVFGVRA